MLTELDMAAIVLTLKLASLTACCLLLLATPLAWWLAHTRTKAKPLIEAIVALPLVLPPTVLGFYLLIAFAPSSPLGVFWHSISGQQLAFSFYALLFGSIIYSLPFAVQPLQNSFEQLPKPLLETAATLGAKPMDSFINLVMPLCRRGFIAAASLSFAHTIGEFGVVLMIGGNIPGETQLISIALYDRVETLDYASAHTMAAGLIVFSIILLAFLYRFNKPTVFARTETYHSGEKS